MQNVILLTSPYSEIGGVSSFVKNILPKLPDNTIVFRRGNQSGHGKWYNMLASIIMPIRFMLVLLFYHPNRIVINTSLGSSLIIRDGILVMLAKLLKRKTLLIIHGFDEAALKHKRLLRWGYFRADAICVLADEFRQKVIEAGFERKVYVQLNPVSEDILALDVKELPPVTKMLYIGRIETAKGVYINLDTFKLLKEKHPEMTFDIVGTGSEYENVKEYIKKNHLEGVTMHGFKSGKEKNDILKSCGFTSSSSSYKEGLPISILEAMAVGQLIISRPVGGIVDLYKQCDFGKMTSSLDAKDFADAYEELIADPTKVEFIRRRNREFALKYFAPKSIVENISRIFNEIK